MFWKKTMENGRKYRDIKLVTKKKERRNYLVSEPNYQATILAIEMKKHICL